MRASLFSLLLCCFFLSFAQPAFADRRVALVVGNGAYQNVARLSNPPNDAAAIAEALRGAGFEAVELRRDLKASELRRALRDFTDAARSADVAIFYFAGHGIEIDGTNYLIPVDAVLERDADASDEAIALDRVLGAVEPARKLRLVILDACRDNPFATIMKRSVAARGVERGLAKVEPPTLNTLVAYAAKAGSTASDGDGANSPFTAALVRYLPKPGLDIRKVFGFTRDEVLRATNNRQEPFIYGSLGGEDFVLVPAPAQVDPAQAIRQDYELAERVGTLEAWDSFLSAYPEGFYAKLAQAQRNKQLAEQARSAAAAKLSEAEQERARLGAESVRANAEAKAAAEARAAEEARIGAEQRKTLETARKAEAERAESKAAEDARRAEEKNKALDEAKAADAERARLAQHVKAAEQARIAAENARAAAEVDAAREQLALERAKALADAKVAELARIQADIRAKLEEDARLSNAQQPAAPNAQKPVGQLAALAPAAGSAPGGKDNTARALQIELNRVGCGPATISDNWDDPAQKSLALFNKSAATTFDTSVASADALDRVRSRSGRVCPLVCEHGYKADGDACVKIVCRSGYQLADDNSCEPIPRNTRRRETPALVNGPEPKAAPAETLRQRPAVLPGGATASGIRRADEAGSAGTYRKCMGPQSGCYERAIRNMTPEMARTWCSRKPSC